MEDPGYPKAGKVYGLHGARCVPLALDESGVPVEAVERSGVQVVHLSPSHQFPSGVVMPIARRQSLLRWAEEEPGRYLIEDDYDSEFRFTGRPIPPLQNIDRAGRVIYMNTFSRSLAPSLRISYMVLPPALLERYQRTLGFYSCTVPAMEQYTLARFLSEGYFETHVNRMRGFYRGRRDQVLDALSRSPLAGRYQVRGEDAGLHFLLRLETERDDRSLARAAEERQIRLSFLSDYGGGESHVLVVSYPGQSNWPACRRPWPIWRNFCDRGGAGKGNRKLPETGKIFPAVSCRSPRTPLCWRDQRDRTANGHEARWRLPLTDRMA